MDDLGSPSSCLHLVDVILATAGTANKMEAQALQHLMPSCILECYYCTDDCSLIDIRTTGTTCCVTEGSVVLATTGTANKMEAQALQHLMPSRIFEWYYCTDDCSLISIRTNGTTCYVTEGSASS